MVASNNRSQRDHRPPCHSEPGMEDAAPGSCCALGCLCSPSIPGQCSVTTAGMSAKGSARNRGAGAEDTPCLPGGVEEMLVVVKLWSSTQAPEIRARF